MRWRIIFRRTITTELARRTKLCRNSSPKPSHDQTLPFEEKVLREHGSGATTSQGLSHTGQQAEDQPEQLLHANHFAQEHDQGKEGRIRFSRHSNCAFAMATQPTISPPKDRTTRGARCHNLELAPVGVPVLVSNRATGGDGTIQVRAEVGVNQTVLLEAA